ncbi:TIGR03915 family putative DNA repair protein, partial [Akkermansiaceae bacterium]|nr:TIGR03915 family putative DNA repair protein [Akkermansiaceae bacterium]
MRTVVITEGFAEWREKARALHAAAVPPAEVLWEEVAADSLFGEEPADLIPQKKIPRITKEFLKLAHTVAHHASADRWGLLYEALFRLSWGEELHLLSLPNDATMARLFKMRKEIGRDIHKMHAFVRFKKVGENSESGREQFVAWFEPDHHIMPLTAGFFRKRFAGMDWSIFTPTGS